MRKEDVVIGKEYEVTGCDMDLSVGEIIKIERHDEGDWFFTENGIVVDCVVFEPSNTIKNKIEPGMRVRYINNSPDAYFEYGRFFTVENIDNGGIYDREGHFAMFENIELVDFLPDDEVIYENRKAKFIKEMDEKDYYGYDCVVSYIDRDRDTIHTLAKKKELSKPKDKSELEVGDKFRCVNANHEILFKTEGKSNTSDSGDVIYFVRVLNGRHKGRTATVFADKIEEIIYD